MADKYTILVQLQADLPEPDRINPKKLEQAAIQVLEMENAAADSMISIVVSTDEHMQEMNKQYRGIDAPTDVLSFPSEPMPQGIDEDEGYLGDIIVSLPYLARRVAQEQRSLHDELALMVVHGTLHLLGYDHDTAETQQAMWAVQAAALKALAIDLIVPDYIHE